MRLTPTEQTHRKLRVKIIGGVDPGGEVGAFAFAERVEDDRLQGSGWRTHLGGQRVDQYVPKVTRSVSGAELKGREWSVSSPFRMRITRKAEAAE